MRCTTPDLCRRVPTAVVEEQGEWFRIILHGRSNVWIKSRNRVRSMVEVVGTDQNAVWMKQEARYVEDLNRIFLGLGWWVLSHVDPTLEVARDPVLPRP